MSGVTPSISSNPVPLKFAIDFDRFDFSMAMARAGDPGGRGGGLRMDIGLMAGSEVTLRIAG